MRIYYSTKVMNFGSDDVTYNALWIALWMEAEAALCFIAACSLSLPKLFQANRKHFSKALSFVSAPLSAVTSSSRKNTTRGTQESSRNSKPWESIAMRSGVSDRNENPPYEASDREILVETQLDVSSHADRAPERDPYALPSPLPTHKRF